MPRRAKSAPAGPKAGAYEHATEHPVRPDVGIEPEFQRNQKKRKPPATYRFDPSLDPQLSWDAQAQRDQAEALLASIRDLADQARSQAAPPADREAALARIRTAAEELQALSGPFLNWTGKAERREIEVPTVPLFVHERLSTRAVLESIRGMKRSKVEQISLFGDPGLDIQDRVLKAYEHQGPWTNRLILGDSLQVMNSLLHYEGLGGKVQMIYMDPPYGVKFNSNFQPFVRKREVRHNDDRDLTREPEMVQAYRDTWELGLHSYLTYLRDRLLLARELLHPSGSVFVQISDDNEHHVRELLDEVFGSGNAVAVITFAKTSGATSELLPVTTDYLLWYAKDRERVKFRQVYLDKTPGGEGGSAYIRVELPDGTRRTMKAAEQADPSLLPAGSRIYTLDNLTSQSIGREKGEGAASWFPVDLDGKTFRPTMQSRWKTNEAGMERLKAGRRLEATSGGGLRYVRFVDDFPVYPLGNNWSDTGIAGFASDKLYVVETNTKVVQRCLLMTTDPGDLILDPTSGSGTTAYVAEHWGRRWITIDVSRVPLALARQRLLTATFPWYELKEPHRGPGGGFVYQRRQNRQGREIGGLVPHVTLKSIAQAEEPEMEVLVDRPEVDTGIVRVTGPFTVEAVIPAAVSAQQATTSLDNDHVDSRPDEGDSRERLLEALRRSPVLRLPKGESVTFRRVRPSSKGLELHAEAEIGPEDNSEFVAFAFGPSHAPVTESRVMQAAREANLRGYAALYVVGFAIEDSASRLINDEQSILPLPVRYVSASMDLQMGDLLKDSRASEVFAAIGSPEVRLVRLKQTGGPEPRYRVELLGVDVFDPAAGDGDPCDHRPGDDVPCWMLDTDYDGMTFRASQVFFPRTEAWNHLQKALRGTYQEGVWQHLAGAVSEPFPASDRGKIAVKVIDDRGNELLVSRSLAEAEAEA